MTILILSVLLRVAGAPAPEGGTPCAACVRWEVTAAQARELLAQAEPLDGVELWVRPSLDDRDIDGLLAGLAARGAHTGLIVSGALPIADGWPARRVLIDLAARQDDDVDHLAYDIKRRVTGIRAADPAAEVGLETSDGVWARLEERGAGAYVDFRVGAAGFGAGARRAGTPNWVRQDAPPCATECLVRAPDDGGRTVLALRAPVDVEVVARRPLDVDEVVARHQAAAARQRRVVARLISTGSLVAAFQVPGLSAPMALTSDVVVYEGEGAREIEQRSLRLNGVEYRAGAAGVPSLPLVEPERVGAPPLAITLDTTYRYRMEGREGAEGRDCYVVAFEPAAAGRGLVRGRAWIDADDFALVRAEASQTGLRGPIVSSQQRDAFTAVEVGDEVVWLLRRSEVHQVYEGPAHRTPIHRVLSLDRLEPNPPDFAARRAAAHASPAVMVADTPEGYRYLRRAPGEAGSTEPGRRETAGRATRVRTMAAGVIVDPSISHPLPFAGIGYTDFDFLGTGAQVNGFFGGVFAQLAWSLPSIGGSRWSAFGAGFAVLASYNDRSFTEGVERYDENLRQRAARLTVGVARPLGQAARLRVGYGLDHTRLARSDTTAPEFVVPASPLVHGLRLSLEAQRGAWNGAVWWSGAVRQHWRDWGLGASERTSRGFQRFGASAGRSFVLSRRAVAQIDGAWMGGRGLDRFSRYSFDGFENRLRGYPSASLRYDHGAVGHGVVTWAAGRVRLDGFLDIARVRDPGLGPRARSYVGAGAAVEVPLPLQALACAEWGYGLQARRGAGETGAHVVRVTAYKAF